MVEKPDDVGVRPSGMSEINGRELDVMRTRIERTEAKMAETLNAIQERISFDYIKHQAEEELLDALEGRVREMMNNLGHMTGELRHSVLEAIKDNPVPAALMGIGLSWLIAGTINSGSSEKSLPEGSYDIEGEGIPEDLYQSGLEEPGGSEYRQSGGTYKYQARIRGAASKVREVAGSAQHRAGHFAEETVERAKHLGSEFRSVTGQKSSRVIQFVEENKLVLSITALALGAAVGFLLPKTGREEKILGGARESIFDKTREFGHKTMEKAERVAEKVGRAAREEAERQHLIGSSS